jgi:hypothetical protein
MCDKCIELDKKIEHYWEITLAIGDELTIERIKALIGFSGAKSDPSS